jgi:hypothetical protein
MSHPQYIEVEGNIYRLVEAAEPQAPMSYSEALRALQSVYFRLFEKADPIPALHAILDVLNFAQSAAKDVEKQLPDAARPTKWSVNDEFHKTLQQLDKTYKKLSQAFRASDRRKALQKFLMARGINVPEAERIE